MSGGGSEQSYSGRLELTWTNKDQRLLAHEDGSYEWLPSSDYRVAEVRLLDNAGVVGKSRADRSRAKDNLLIRGDALNALTSLAELPEFSRELVGKVKLAYLDPPFNTQQSFLQYDDALEHSVWLTMMRDRLVQIAKLLAPDGSVWVHCDDSEQAYLKVVMDELFGRQNFVACVVWESAQGGRGTDIGATHDYLLVYAREKEIWGKVRNLLPRNATQSQRFKNPDSDPRGPWRQGDDGTAKSGSDKSRWPITLPSGRAVRPKEGRYWAFSKDTFEKARSEGRVWFGKNGDSMPIIKRYLSEVQKGVAPKTWWPAAEVGSNQEAKRDHLNKLLPDVAPFETPKPERLLARILHIGSDPGDTVIDCFVGSGTTAAAAHKMGRRWIGVERNAETLDKYAIPRLTKVIDGDDPMGITDQAGWQGGGGFRILDVAPSMFGADGGVVVLADWATNGKLAEATAAQLGFEFESDPPFTGRKGRTRLAVIDGLISTDVVQLIASTLGEDERAVVCGTAVDPAAGKVLREARAGSSVRKIPASILDEYRQVRWTPKVIAERTGSGNGSAPSVGGRNVSTEAGARTS
jgi:adenine-specific DNA-methyltransferase